MKKFYITLALVVLFFTGCAPKYEHVPFADFGSKIKETKGQIEQQLSFSLVKPEIKIQGVLGKGFYHFGYNRIIQEMKIARNAMNREIEKIILQKGITVTNTFDSLNDMTYSEKKNTTGVFMPRIIMTLTESGTSMISGNVILNTNSILHAKIDIDLVAIEPLSSERIWVKSLPKIKSNISMNYSIPQGAISSSPVMILEPLVPAVKQLDSVLLNVYDNVLNSVDKYVSLEEFQDLNDDINALKGIKRY